MCVHVCAHVRVYMCIDMYMYVRVCIYVYINLMDSHTNDLGYLIPTVLHSYSNVLPVQIIRPIYSRPTESETVRIGPIICLLTRLPTDQ